MYGIASCAKLRIASMLYTNFERKDATNNFSCSKFSEKSFKEAAYKMTSLKDYLHKFRDLYILDKKVEHIFGSV